MKKLILLFVIITFLISCSQNQETRNIKSFDYTVKGTVIGQDTGRLVIQKSNRLGDEIFIPIKDGKFSYSGKSIDIFQSGIRFYESYFRGGGRFFPLILEPGLIKLELDKDSIHYKSKVLKGNINLQVQKVNKKAEKYFKIIFNDKNTQEEREYLLKNVYSDTLVNLVIQNADNYGSIYLLNMFVSWDILNVNQLNSAFSKIKNPELRHTPAFKTAYSQYLAKVKNVNQVGEKAANFILPDSSGKMVNFSEISKGKTVFVEKSGSWCNNQTYETHNLDSLYQEFKSKGFEIVTIVRESNHNRWENWLRKNRFPWINVVEMEFGNPNDVYYADLLFANGDYFVVENGEVIANNVSVPQLKELLMEKYEPEKYKQYIANKWKLPEGTYIIGKDKPINSFAELTNELKGKAFLINCWSLYCEECRDEFKNNDSLRKFLDKNNIVIVNIVFNNIDDETWLDYIRNHLIPGYNMKASSEFEKNLLAKAPWDYTVPAYFIVDKSGNVAPEQLLLPSAKEKMYNQIRKNLKLGSN